MVHHHRVRSAGIRHDGAQYPHVHFQIVEEAAIRTFPPGLHHGDISRNGTGSDVPDSIAGIGRHQRRNVD